MEKRYFWIKLKEDFFDSEQMDFIHDMPNGAEYIYIYLRLCLRFANNDGIVERRIGPDVRLSYDMQKLAEIVHSTPDSVVVAIQVFKQIGLVEEIHNGAFIIPGVRDMVGSESAVAQRVRKHRALKRIQESQPLLQCNENVTFKVTTENRDKRLDTRDKSIDKDIEKKSRKRRFSVVDAIDGLPLGMPSRRLSRHGPSCERKTLKPLFLRRRCGLVFPSFRNFAETLKRRWSMWWISLLSTTGKGSSR